MEEDAKGGFTAPGDPWEFQGQIVLGLAFATFAVSAKNYFVDAAVLGYFAILADSLFRQRQRAKRLANFHVGAASVLVLLFILPLAASPEAAVRPKTMDGLRQQGSP